MYAKTVTHCHTHIDETYYVDCLEELSDFLACKRRKLCLSSINRVTFAEREFSRVGYEQIIVRNGSSGRPDTLGLRLASATTHLHAHIVCVNAARLIKV